MTLAKSVAHLSTEITTQASILNEMDRMGEELDLVKQHVNFQNNSVGGIKQMMLTSQPIAVENPSTVHGETNPQKISKLTR